MALTTPNNFNSLIAELTQEIIPFPHGSFKVRMEWTPEQFGDLPNGERNVQKQYRVRRWLAAWQATCIAYGMTMWSRYVPCAQCGGPVDVYRADADHIVSRANNGESNNGNLALLHPACNRILKQEKNAPAHIVNAFRAAGKSVVTFRFNPRENGNESERLAEFVWNYFDRGTN